MTHIEAKNFDSCHDNQTKNRIYNHEGNCPKGNIYKLRVIVHES